MDMSKYAIQKAHKLKKHCLAIREYKVEVAEMVFYLHANPPNPSAAKEILDELGEDGVNIWSCSTRDGGIWERWERDALKYGELTEAYEIWRRRNNR